MQSRKASAPNSLRRLRHAGEGRYVADRHEEGKLDDSRAVLGNDIAIQACREGKQELPGGTVIARLAWAYAPSAMAIGTHLNKKGDRYVEGNRFNYGNFSHDVGGACPDDHRSW
jgi:hypothetical protein